MNTNVHENNSGKRKFEVGRYTVKALALRAVCFEWLILAFCAIGFHLFSEVWIYPLIWFLVGTRLYAFYSLLHEAVHFHIHPNKKWNDAIASVFLAFPLFVNLQEMRRVHWAHHKYLGTEKDPEHVHLDYAEFQFPLTGHRLFWISLGDFSGFNFARYKLLALVKWLKAPSLDVLKGSFLFYGCIFFIAIFFGYTKVLILVWLIPYATLYQWLNRMRLYTEHFNLPKDQSEGIRSLELKPWLAFFLAPYGLGFHAAHHKYPDLPFSELKKVHQGELAPANFARLTERNYLKMLQKISAHES